MDGAKVINRPSPKITSKYVLNVLTGQCLDRRIDSIETVKKEVAEWQKFRNNKNAKVNWQFTTADARVKLSRLYPTLDS
jgi:predicted AAA+ superfamily ATPase